MTTTALKISDSTLPLGSLETYLARIKCIPLLSAQEEQELAERHYEHHDLKAAKRLILTNLRFVVHIAQSYLGYGLPLPDLIQEGNIGLMKAIKRFNPKIGVRLISFAVHWIKAEIQEFILRNWRIVKCATTKEKRKLFFNLRKLKQNIGWLTHQEVHSIAKELKVNPKQVREMEGCLSAQDMSVDINENTQDTFKAPPVHFEDYRYDPARLLEKSDFVQYSQDHLYKVLPQLDERSQTIITRRWLRKPRATLQELADYYCISPERVRQIEFNAIAWLRNKIEEVA